MSGKNNSMKSIGISEMAKEKAQQQHPLPRERKDEARG